MGPSGSGKSTLLNCMAGLDRLTSGTVEIGGVDLRDLSDRDLTILRRTRLGFIFQSFNLLPALTARENITYPLDLSRSRVDPQWFDELIGVLGLRDRLDNRPSQLSGGQQQRVAVARALVSKPEVVFADEPTGSLDSHTSGEILSHLRKASDLGQTVVMVTHDPYAAAHTHNVVFFQDGAPVGELASPTADGVLDRMKSLGADR
ncbi:MAG TPA: ABC transporter ATP-binding protein, partial [Actinomycetota bacterium]|nr:ABC transporter ATP-binding protein [Actinomycetota bacterium]